jgi:hypothetical protein
LLMTSVHGTLFSMLNKLLAINRSFKWVGLSYLTVWAGGGAFRSRWLSKEIQTMAPLAGCDR